MFDQGRRSPPVVAARPVAAEEGRTRGKHRDMDTRPGETAAARPLLDLRDVSRSYGDRVVLDTVSLSVAPGECVALVGENGSGKSTLLRMAAGRETPTSGTVLFDGDPFDEDSATARVRIATVMDAGAFYPDLTVREHLMLIALGHGLADGADPAVDEVLAHHRLSGHADVLPSALSSGQTQALLLAAAFVRPHDLLVLDEPEQRLDAQARRELARRVAAHRDAGVAVLLATHHPALSAVADRVVELDAETGTETGPDTGTATEAESAEGATTAADPAAADEAATADPAAAAGAGDRETA
ncbi:ATP-binding cassette domain-containing protein [Streptomyces sp. NPDC004111]|uniref:ABC transporter ATP-binding protein n=1 Tax=Streptomyces sp. NPDC004111 TaxID=3364690 RepID=UPI0036BDEFE9